MQDKNKTISLTEILCLAVSFLFVTLSQLVTVECQSITYFDHHVCTFFPAKFAVYRPHNYVGLKLACELFSEIFSSNMYESVMLHMHFVTQLACYCS